VLGCLADDQKRLQQITRGDDADQLSVGKSRPSANYRNAGLAGMSQWKAIIFTSSPLFWWIAAS
jgi:hypothetical protein